MKKVFLALSLMALAGCSTYQIPSESTFPANSTFAVMPIANYSNSPLAAEKVEQLISTELFAKNISHIVYKSSEEDDLQTILDDSKKQQKAEQWLENQNANLVITGSVNEWNYKAGLDGEPVVGLTLEIRNAKSGQVYWKASGNRSGWGRESLNGAGQKVVEKLLDDVTVTGVIAK